MSAGDDIPLRPAPGRLGTVLRVTGGNLLEMFDFFLFGLYASDIAATFFPAGSEFSSLMLAFAVFGSGFLMRPLGAVVLGAYVDRVGRRRGLMATLAIMACGTVLIAFVPGYASIGPLAPLLVLAGRLLQGFSAGVELGGVSVYLAEMATPGHRGFYVSWQSASQQVAIIAAATIGAGLTLALAPAQIAAWGWRIPFVLGCLIVPFLFVIRSSLPETGAFLARQRPAPRESLRAMAAHWPVVLAGMMLVAMTTVSFYLITVYTPTFGRSVLHLGARDSLTVTLLVAASNLAWLPAMGALSDRIGRRPILLAAAVLAALTTYPAMRWLVAEPGVGRMLAVELWLSFLYASYNGAMVVALAEVMPVAVRTAGFSLAYSLATAIFGGNTPAVSTLLIRLLGDKAAPGLWMSFAAVCGLGATLVLYGKGSPEGSKAGLCPDPQRAVRPFDPMT